MENKVILKDIVYDITSDVYIGVWNQDTDIILGIDIDAETDSDDVEYALSSIRLYNEEGFNTHVSSYEELKGKKYVWDSVCNDDDEMAGSLYVLEHEDITQATIEILDVVDDIIKIKWSGLANVYWDDEYGEDVPFETTFTAKLPQNNKYTIQAFESNKTKIASDTELELLELDEFNKEVEKMSLSREWNTFNTTLKFKLIYQGREYLGHVVFKDGKNNYETFFDDKCPLKAEFIGFDFNLRAEYEEFRFTID